MAQGLLDFVQSPAGMGLLSAGLAYAASANRNTPINNIGRAGLAGLTGYTAAGALQEQTAKRQQAEAVRQAIPSLYTKGEDGSMKFDTIAAAKLGLDPDMIKGYSEVPNYGRAKVARTQSIAGPDGGKQVVQLDDYGNQVGEGLAGYVKPEMVDTGSTKQFVVPTAGQSFQVGLSPAEILANQRGNASLQLRAENNRLIQDANDINRTATRTELFKGADGTTYRVDRGTGAVTPLTTPDGKPLKSDSASTLTESEGKNTLFLSQMVDAEHALGQLAGTASPIAVAATGSPYTNWGVDGESQKAAQAQRQWAEAYLRAKTGAAATQGEVENNIRTFFPVTGDGEDVIQRKAEARARAAKDMRIPAGRGAGRVEQPAQQPVGGIKFLGFE